MKYWEMEKRGRGEKLRKPLRGRDGWKVNDCFDAGVLGAFANGSELLDRRGRRRGSRHHESSAVNHITPHLLTRVLWAQITGSQPNLAHQSIRQVLLSHNLAWNVSIPPQSWGLRLHRRGSQIHFSLSQQCCPGPQPG